MEQTKQNVVYGGLPAENQAGLSEMEIDALGESVNISMGAAAGALSTILNRKVSITTPQVTIKHSSECEYQNMVPAVGVKINYVEGIIGTNFFVLKQNDVRRIVNIMTGMDAEGDDSPLTELHSSAISEVMNQMMGASSTSLAIFFNRKVGISTPDCLLMESNMTVGETLGYDGDIVAIRFKLTIGDIIDSELVNVMSIAFAKELADNLIHVQLPSHSQSVARQEVYAGAQPDQLPSMPQFRVEQGEMNMTANDRHPSAQFAAFNKTESDGKPALSNLNVIMDVPLEVIVQIGKTKKQIMEILEFTQGTIIELDKQAGDPVDIIVNGRLIARGDVVVIDDNFGVRITQIIHG